MTYNLNSNLAKNVETRFSHQEKDQTRTLSSRAKTTGNDAFKNSIYF